MKEALLKRLSRVQSAIVTLEEEEITILQQLETIYEAEKEDLLGSSTNFFTSPPENKTAVIDDLNSDVIAIILEFCFGIKVCCCVYYN